MTDTWAQKWKLTVRDTQTNRYVVRRTNKHLRWTEGVRWSHGEIEEKFLKDQRKKRTHTHTHIKKEKKKQEKLLEKQKNKNANIKKKQNGRIFFSLSCQPFVSGKITTKESLEQKNKQKKTTKNQKKKKNQQKTKQKTKHKCKTFPEKVRYFF